MLEMYLMKKGTLERTPSPEHGASNNTLSYLAVVSFCNTCPHGPTFLIIYVDKSLTMNPWWSLVIFLKCFHWRSVIMISSVLFLGLCEFHGNLQHIVEDQHGCQWSYHLDRVTLLRPWVFSSDLCLCPEPISFLYQSTWAWQVSKLLSIRHMESDQNNIKWQTCWQKKTFWKYFCEIYVLVDFKYKHL